MAKNFIADKVTLDKVDTNVSDIKNSVDTLGTDITSINSKIGDPGGNDIISLINTITADLNILGSRLTAARASQLDRLEGISNVVSAGIGIKRIISSSVNTTTAASYVDVSHSTVDLSKSFIILNGGAYPSGTTSTISFIYIASRTANNFRVAFNPSYANNVIVFSYQIVEFY